jgi:hypothetical protein
MVKQALAIHRNKKLFVRLGVLHFIHEEIHRFKRIHIGQVIAENPDALQRLFIEQQIIPAGAGGYNVNSREDALVRQFAVKLQLHVAGALEFFKDHLVHFGACINKSSSDNGQRAAVFDLACSAEEALGF